MVRKRGRTFKKVVRSLSSRNARLSPYAFGHALGVVSIVALLFYAVMSWFGGYDASVISAQYPLGFSFTSWTLIIGLIETYVMGYIGGWIFVKVYNKFSR